jgi:hypothetical protein
VVEDQIAQSVLEGPCAGLAMSCHCGATLSIMMLLLILFARRLENITVATELYMAKQDAPSLLCNQLRCQQAAQLREGSTT